VAVRVCVCVCVCDRDGWTEMMTESLTKWMKGKRMRKVDMQSVSDRLGGWRKREVAVGVVDNDCTLYTNTHTHTHTHAYITLSVT